MVLEPSRMEMRAVAIPSDDDNWVAPEVGGAEEDIVGIEGVDGVVAELVGVVVPITVGTIRVNAVGTVIGVEVGAESFVPGVTMTACAVRAVLLGEVSILFYDQISPPAFKLTDTRP